MSSRSVRLSHSMHLRKKEEAKRLDVVPLVWGTSGNGPSKSPMWESEGVSGSEDESVSSSGSREDNVGNEALHVIGLYWPGDKISLFLQDWELAKVALSCHIALDMLCQEMNVTALALSSHRGQAVTPKERVVVRGNKEVGTSDEPFLS